jgi:two-component system LytT family response regulator
LKSNNRIEKLTLPHTHGFHVIETNNILYIEADSNYSVFHLKDKTKLIVSKPLKEFEDMLDSSDFVRVHKSAIINLNYVSNYSNKHGFEVILDSNVTIPVSRRRSAEFQDKIKEHLQGRK